MDIEPDDPYQASFASLEAHLDRSTFAEAISEFCEVERSWPDLEGTTMSSLYVKHALSNNIERQWERKLELGLSTSISKAQLHRLFRGMETSELKITHSTRNQTYLCTEYRREFIRLETVNDTPYLTIERNAFSKQDAKAFLPMPFADWQLPDGVEHRLATVILGPTRRDQHRFWAVDDPTTVGLAFTQNPGTERWTNEPLPPNAKETVIARLRHIGSDSVVDLDQREGPRGRTGIHAWARPST